MRRRSAGIIAIAIPLGLAAFALGRLLTAGGGTDSTARQPDVASLIQQRQAADEAEIPFTEAELLGITLASSMETMPADIRSRQDRLIAGGCVSITRSSAPELDLARGFTLAKEYAMEADSPHATACGGHPSGLQWDYTVDGAQGTVGTVSIVRVTTNYETANVAASRVSTQVVGGREAIVVRPRAADGLAEASKVIFPETFGMTVVQAFNVSETQLLEVANAVAEVTQ